MTHVTQVPRIADAHETDWRGVVEPYIGANIWRAVYQVISTLGLLALSMWLMGVVLDYSIPLGLLFALPTAGLLVRTFILMHDCAHGSLFPSRRLNETIGFITGVITMTPFAQWRRDHALHHASSGDLDRRGHGDVPTLTVREYLAKTPREQLIYRTIRHPASLLFVGPVHLMLSQRIRSRSKATRDRQISSVWGTNACLALALAAAMWAFGWWVVLLVYFVSFYFAAMAGVWLFYVQHQFEDAYWEDHGEWDYVTACLRGSSHLQLSGPLRWFTGNIGLHHVHHLAPRIPNFRLQRCHDENPLFQQAPVVTPLSGLSALRLALWDEDQRRLVRFKQVRVS
ncbi:MAG TPA: fatty acid desaturase [Gemmatimonadaceae bacterium]|jgi:omega-6 fatty acid desaturase (delta-12 desaturase)